eukprot:gnl/TRDRNA2_/TRDRNA2_175559_c0_seq11.p1 gnl/TRDRNA2_/TRDRNA2_175559_c0~~gnl/TRDRNA2_/TRDRNA2_175559_c0_seq11.p1  ORF type:complete len:243 (+),score=22.22 gnl/TRDRNA2_/TRDRNA2_175559_c0_seq11:3-731(+)
MSISVHQPERHTIFVAPSGCASGNTLPTAMMACGSADIDPCNFTCPQVKNTFLDIDGKQQQIFQDRRRSRSAPPSLHGDDVINAPVLAPPHPQWHQPISRLPKFKPCLTSSSPPSLHQSSAASNDNTLESSGCSVCSAGNAEVLLGNGAVPIFSADGALTGTQKLEGSGCKSLIKLSPMIQTKASGFPSLGSVGHAENQCRVCAFHSISGKYCVMGSLCERCHDTHQRVNTRRIKSKRSVHQ